LATLAVRGVSVHYDDIGPAQGPVVVMSGSLAADLSMWDAQAASLSADYRVVRYDTRGHGRTQATEGDYSLDLLADDVLGLMDAIGVGRFHFIGLSLGGMIGQVLGARAADRLVSLTLCATFASADRELWDRRAATAWEQGLGSIVEPTLERWLTPAFRTARPDVAERVRAMILGTSRAGYAGCAAAIRDMDLTGVAERIDVPTLLIAAADDPSATPELMSAIYRRIRHARIETIEHAAHLFTIERPETTNRLLKAFLDEIQGAEGRREE
jgi:3-oxoadipate enol-lactonase